MPYARIYATEASADAAFYRHPTPMALVSAEGEWLAVNRALVHFLGYAEAELLEMNFRDVTHPKDIRGDEQQVRRVLAGEIRDYTEVKRYLTKSGRERWARLYVQRIDKEDGSFDQFLSVIDPLPNGGMVEINKTEDGKTTVFSVTPTRLQILQKYWPFLAGFAIYQAMTGNMEGAKAILNLFLAGLGIPPL